MAKKGQEITLEILAQGQDKLSATVETLAEGQDRLGKTVDTLAKGQEDLAKDLRQEMKQSIEDFAIIVAKGFEGQQKYMDDRFDSVDKRFDAVEGRLTNVENTTERIELRLGSFAYRFEFNELQGRVERLEKGAGLA